MTRLSCLFVLGLGALVGCGGSTSSDTDSTTQGGMGGTAGTGGAGQAGSGQAGSGQAGGGQAGAAGSAAGTAGAGGGQAGAGGSIISTGDIVGSYDLTFGAVTQDKKPFGNVEPVSPGATARLDIRKTGGGYEALVTPRLRPAVAVTVQVSAATVVLDGSVVINGQSGGYNVSESWQSFTLGRTAGGDLDGTVALTGEQSAYGGDVVSSAAITGAATIGADTTAPGWRVRASSPVALDGPMLPWGTIEVRASEGIPAGLVAALAVSAGGQALGTSATVEPASDETAWGGLTAATLRLDDWNLAGGPLTVSRTATLLDPSKNEAQELASTVTVQSVPGPQTVHGFDDDIVSTTLWGTATLLGGGLVGSSDPLCEAGGCAMFGPMPMGYCVKETAGLAARVKVEPATKAVAVRFRIAAAEASSNGLSPLVVQVTSTGGKTTSQSSSVTLVNSGADDELPFVSEWTTLEAPLPEGAAGEVGVTVAAGNNMSCGFVPPAVKARVLVERIEAK